ncbi:acyl-CoA dehydrogenase family protein [Rhodococcus sp. USK13]|uniref:acyl-CoA dehydrogenase family protein n=1 Tax=Rhodococcus sp. USK13 TaxID=2806442 RepID=UPI001BCE6A23|nr:acyl-CoA dehydrogenase family protein [Rhodococcus sp. USK13]
MLNFALSDEQRAMRDSVRAFLEKEIIPHEPQVLSNERAGRPGMEDEQIRDLQLKARRSGFWGIATPAEYGGADLGPVMTAIVTMENGRTFVPFRFGGSADNILFEGTDDQKAEYLVPTIEGERRSCFALSEPDAGSDARRIRARAVPDGDDWVIHGEKTFITNGHRADFAIVFANTPETATAQAGVTCFLVDRSHGWTSHPIPTMGDMNAAGLSFDAVRVPSRNVLGSVGRGFELAMQWIGRGRWVIPARAVGASERMLEMAVSYANTRRTFGQPIAEYQAIQWMIADSHVEIESAKWLTLYAAWREENGIDGRHASSVAKLHGSTIANEVADRVMQIHGGMGYTKELPIERWYRELRVMRIYEGTDEIQRRTIAKNLLSGQVRLSDIGGVLR